MTASTGRLIVVSAPSGGGKGTLIRHARECLRDIAVTISATTRPPRPGEQDGREYYFLPRRDFEQKIAENAFVEWAEVHGNLYGTLKSEIDRLIQSGKTVLFELDVQGMRAIKKMYPNAASIFIAPPRLEILRDRLLGRGTNAPDDIEVRLANAKAEMRAAAEYDHVVVNNELEQSCTQFVELLEALRTHP